MHEPLALSHTIVSMHLRSLTSPYHHKTLARLPDDETAYSIAPSLLAAAVKIISPQQTSLHRRTRMAHRSHQLDDPGSATNAWLARAAQILGPQSAIRASSSSRLLSLIFHYDAAANLALAPKISSVLAAPAHAK